jgi:hypothetical protein
MATPNTSSEGGLYELVTKGNKDLFFFSDSPSSKFLFANDYQAQTPSVSEIRRIPPRTAAEFGRTVDFDFDLVGDSMTHPTILITLPSWLPPPVASTLSTSTIEDSDGVTYGYTNGIAYFLFEQLQIYQDTILLQEFSGDYLWAASRISGTYGEIGITPYLTGEHDNSPLGISRNASPPMLRLQLPVIGCQKKDDPGFPQRAITKHSYKLRCKMRKLQDLVEASDGRQKPDPWGKSNFFQQRSASSSPIQFTTLKKEEMNPLLLQLETTQVYYPFKIQQNMEKNPIRIPFLRVYENIFTQNQLDYSAIVSGGTSIVNRRLDGRHPTGKLVWFFRTNESLLSNQLWKVFSGYNTIAFNIAGQSRELSRTPLTWRDINNYAKEDIDSGTEIGTMNFSLGQIASGRFPEHDSSPNGTINMSTADRPTFYITLSLPPNNSINTELRVFTEGWSIFQTDGKGRAEQFSMN